MRILPFAGMQIRLDASASDEQALTMSTHSPDKQGDPLDPQAQEKEKVLRNRNKQLKIWLTEREKQSIFSKAKRAGLSVSGYILLLNKGYVPKDSPPPDYYHMVRELRAIGNSIHQIAARASATGFIHAERYAQLVTEFNIMLLSIQEAVTKPEKISHGNDEDMEG